MSGWDEAFEAIATEQGQGFLDELECAVYSASAGAELHHTDRSDSSDYGQRYRSASASSDTYCALVLGEYGAASGCHLLAQLERRHISV